MEKRQLWTMKKGKIYIFLINYHKEYTNIIIIIGRGEKYAYISRR